MSSFEVEVGEKVSVPLGRARQNWRQEASAGGRCHSLWGAPGQRNGGTGGKAVVSSALRLDVSFS